MQRHPLLLVAAAVVVLGAAAYWLLRDDSQEYDWFMQSVEGVSPQSLRVNFERPSPCDTFKRVEVRESAERVTLTVVLVGYSGDCTMNVVPGSEVVTLDRPLDGRVIIDGGCESFTNRSCEDPTVDPL